MIHYRGTCFVAKLLSDIVLFFDVVLKKLTDDTLCMSQKKLPTSV